MVAVPFLGGSGESLKFSIKISNAETRKVITEMGPTVLSPDGTERRDRKLRLKIIHKFLGFMYQNTIHNNKKEKKSSSMNLKKYLQISVGKNILITLENNERKINQLRFIPCS